MVEDRAAARQVTVLSQNVYYRGLRLSLGGKQLAVASTDLKLPSYYINRELSQLEFCRRVLFMARDGGLPMLERLRYLSITSGILDEFFEIRVAGLKQQAD